jgi:hypothetical protein
MSLWGSGFGAPMFFKGATYLNESGHWVPIGETKRQRNERLQAQIRKAIKETMDAKERR